LFIVVLDDGCLAVTVAAAANYGSRHDECINTKLGKTNFYTDFKISNRYMNLKFIAN